MADSKLSSEPEPSPDAFKVPEVGRPKPSETNGLLAPKTPNMLKEVMFVTPPDVTQNEVTDKENRTESTPLPTSAAASLHQMSVCTTTPAATPMDSSALSKLLTAAQLTSSSGLETPSRAQRDQSNAAKMYMTPASTTAGPESKENKVMETPVRPRIGMAHKTTTTTPDDAQSEAGTPGPNLYSGNSINDKDLTRKKRRRTSPMELHILEEEFSRCSKPSKTIREDIARRVDMTEKAVQIWFQNRRQAVRKQELLFSSSSNDGGSSDTGGFPMTPAHKFKLPSTPATGRAKGPAPALKFPSEGVIQYRIDGYQHKVSQPVSVTASKSSSNPFSEGLLMNNHKLGSMNLFDTKDSRRQSLPVKGEKFAIFSDADTDEETEANSQSFDSRYSMTRPTISSVREEVPSGFTPAQKRQLVAGKKSNSPKKSGVASLRLSMSSSGEAEVVVERVVNGCSVRPVPLAGKAKSAVPSIKEEDEGEPTNFKTTTHLLRSKLAKSLLKAREKKLKSPSKRGNGTTNSVTPPHSPSKLRNKLVFQGRRSPLSPRKAMQNAMSMSRSPSKPKRTDSSVGSGFSAASFPALPKSRSFTSALLMRHQAPPAYSTGSSVHKGKSKSKSPRRVLSPRKAASRDIPSSPPFRRQSYTPSSSSGSSSSSSGSAGSRKRRAFEHSASLANLDRHKFAQVMANATVAASAAAKSGASASASGAGLAHSPESRHSIERRRRRRSLDLEEEEDGEAGRPRKKQRNKAVETREAECINNLLSLRSGDWS